MEQDQNVILYSTRCPKCKVLEKKLNDKGVKYTENTDIEYMLSLGIQSAPMLEVDGERMNFNEAIKWVNEI